MPQPDREEILGRLELIDRMASEGRQTTQRWGWVFVLWGFGPLAGMWWESYGPHPEWAWPLILLICVLVNGIVIQTRKRQGEARTTLTRSVAAVWGSAGIAVFVLTAGEIFSRAVDLRAFLAALFAIAACAHSASSAILRWPLQRLAALVWWASTLAAFVLPVTELHALAAAALLLGNVAFGACLAYREWSHRDE